MHLTNMVCTLYSRYAPILCKRRPIFRAHPPPPPSYIVKAVKPFVAVASWVVQTPSLLHHSSALSLSIQYLQGSPLGLFKVLRKRELLVGPILIYETSKSINIAKDLRALCNINNGYSNQDIDL